MIFGIRSNRVGNLIAVLLFALILQGPAWSVGSIPAVTVTQSVDRSQYRTGDTATIILDIAIPEGFHLYGNPLGPGIGKPLRVKTPPNPRIAWISSAILPPVKYSPEAGEWVWAYTGSTTVFVTGVIQAETPDMVTVALDGLMCEKSCIPVAVSVNVELKAAAQGAGAKRFSDAEAKRADFLHAQMLPLDTGNVPAHQMSGIDLGGFASPTNKASDAAGPVWEYSPVEPQSPLHLPMALLFGLLAGLLLNVMPCVLPVLGIKILSFSRGRENSSAVLHSLIFSAGMLAVFAVLASLAAFAKFSWGEHFQNPAVLSIIVCAIVFFALGLFGFYRIGLPPVIGHAAVHIKPDPAGDFFRGALTAVLATPCSGPFLGATLAWTLGQSPLIIYVVFFAIGTGMALPYVVFSASSTLRRMMPKPGHWMVDFEHLMGFFLLAAAVYLMLGLPGPMTLATTSEALIIVFAVAIWRRFVRLDSTVLVRTAVIAAALLLVVGGGWFNYTVIGNRGMAGSAIQELGSQAGTWREFTPEKLRDAHAAGRHVVVDFTAGWCMNCQYNKVAILDSKEITALLGKKDVLALTADLTVPQPVIESLLHNLGSRSIPFLAIFPGDDPYHPIVMRDILDKRKLSDVLKGLAEK